MQLSGVAAIELLAQSSVDSWAFVGATLIATGFFVATCFMAMKAQRAASATEVKIDGVRADVTRLLDLAFQWPDPERDGRPEKIDALLDTARETVSDLADELQTARLDKAAFEAKATAAMSGLADGAWRYTLSERPDPMGAAVKQALSGMGGHASKDDVRQQLREDLGAHGPTVMRTIRRLLMSGELEQVGPDQGDDTMIKLPGW